MTFRHGGILHERLQALKEDIPIATFLDHYFGEERFAAFRQSIVAMVKGYDAADPARASTFAIRDEFLDNNSEMQQARIKEGYGALLEFLANECRNAGCDIRMNCEVKAIDIRGEVTVCCANGKRHQAEKAIVTLPISLLPAISFSPPLPQKLAAAGKIGFGGVIKTLIRFREPWWMDTGGRDLARMTFVFSGETIPTWWTQYPESHPTLTGWLAGPDVERFRHAAPQAIADAAFDSLSNIFKVPKKLLLDLHVVCRVLNWPEDPFALGAYSYKTVGAQAAYRELSQPVGNRLFFAGEALREGTEASTVEGALASGAAVADEILRS